jgi:tetratricopeptide (TPR) repeat protein
MRNGKSAALRAGAFLLLAFMLPACSGGEARKAKFLEKGTALMAERNYEKARLEFRNALQIDPKDAQAQALAARAAEQLGEYGEAAGLYQAAIAGNKADTKSRASLARIFVFGGAPERAAKLVEEGLALAPNDPDLIAVRGAAKLQKGDKDGAFADAQAAIAIAPGNSNAAALVASLYAQRGQLPAAIGAVQTALAADPKSLELLIVLAQLQLANHEPALAQKSMDQLVALDPQNLVHRYRLAQFYLLQKDVDAAEATLRKAIEVQPEDVGAKLALANLIASHRSFEAGEKSLKELIAASQNSLPLQLGLGQFYEAHQRPEKAEEVYRAVIKDNGTGAQGLTARNRIAALELKGNRPAEAAKLLEEVLKESPRDNEALSMRASLALARGDAPAAITDLRAVLRDQPNSQPVLRTLSRAYLANKDPVLAEESLRQAISVNPRDIPTRLELAQLLIQGGKPDQAQPVIDQLVADQPGNVQALEAAFRVQAARKDLNGARKSALAIQAVNPDLPVGWYLAGLVDQSENKLDDARRAFEHALELAPDSTEPLTALLRVDVAQKQPDRALARLDDVIKRFPRNALVRNMKGELLLGLQRREAAGKVFEEAIALAPEWWVPYRGLAVSEIAGGPARYDAAFAAYRRGIEASKSAPPLVIELASTYERLGRSTDAAALYEDWLKREPQSEVAGNNLAMLLIMRDKPDRASLDRALQLALPLEKSSNAAFLDTAGWVRYVRGEYTQAIPLLQRAVDLSPGAPALRAHLGLAQYKAGQNEAAKSNLTDAVAGNANYKGIEEARAALKAIGGG